MANPELLAAIEASKQAEAKLRRLERLLDDLDEGDATLRRNISAGVPHEWPTAGDAAHQVWAAVDACIATDRAVYDLAKASGVRLLRLPEDEIEELRLWAARVERVAGTIK